MLRHLQVPRLAQKTIMIRVDYLVRVISLLLLIGILTSCVPEEDAVESSSSGGGASLGGAQILWGSSTSSTVTFSTPFTETPVVTATPINTACAYAFIQIYDNSSGVGKGKTGFTYIGCSSFDWQAIGR